MFWLSEKTVIHRILVTLELIQEKCVREIVLKAMGQAISKAVAIAEILKVNFPLDYYLCV